MNFSMTRAPKVLLRSLALACLTFALMPIHSVAKEVTVYYWRSETGKLHISDTKPNGVISTPFQVTVPQKIGSVEPTGSCDSSLKNQSKAYTWQKKSTSQRKKRKKIYTCTQSR